MELIVQQKAQQSLTTLGRHLKRDLQLLGQFEKRPE